MTTCPKCKHEFEVTPPWDAGYCPKCNASYIWDEISWVDADGTYDSYPVVDWRTWDELTLDSRMCSRLYSLFLWQFLFPALKFGALFRLICPPPYSHSRCIWFHMESLYFYSL